MKASRIRKNLNPPAKAPFKRPKEPQARLPKETSARRLKQGPDAPKYITEH